VDEFGEITGALVDYNIRFLRQVVFEVTEGCNLRCAYCGFSDLYTPQEGRSSRNLPYSFAESLLSYLFSMWEDDRVRELPISTAISFYGGEPLLNFPLIKSIIAFVEREKKRTNRAFTYSLTTNATLLPDYIDFLVEHRVRILVSLDGDAYGDSYRVDAKGKPSYYRVYENIKRVMELFPDYYADCVSFNAVLTDRNRYEDIVSYFEREFGKTPQISPLSTSGINPAAKEKFEKIKNKAQPDNRILPLEVAPSFKAFMKSFELRSGNYYYDFSELLFNRLKKKKIVTGTCYPFSRKMFLAADGKILQCEKIDHTHSLGCVSESGVQLDVDEVASLHNAAIKKYSTSCPECPFKHECPQCIRLADTPECIYRSRGQKKPFGFESVSYNPSGALEAVYNSKTKR